MTRKAITPRRTLTGLAIAAPPRRPSRCPSTGVAGVAALQDDVLAIAPLDDIPTRVEMVKQTKAKVTRVDILWSFVAPTRPANPTDPNDPAYDWSRLDLIFTSLAASNIRIIVSTYSTPTWAVAGKNQSVPSQYNPNAPRPADYANFMAAVTKRYSGTFMPAGSAVPLPRVRHCEIWNEPNIVQFFRFNGKSSLPKYKALIKAAYPKIKASNPSGRGHRRRRRPAQQHRRRQHRLAQLDQQHPGRQEPQVRRLLAAHLPVEGPDVHVEVLRQGVPHLVQPARDLRGARTSARRA